MTNPSPTSGEELESRAKQHRNLAHIHPDGGPVNTGRLPGPR